MMRHFLCLIPLLVLPLVPLSGALSSAEPTALDAPFAQEDSPLAEAMEVLKKGQRALKKLKEDLPGNQAALLEHLKGMELATQKALAEVPVQPAGLSKKDAALFQLAYRREMAKLLVQVLTLQEATWRADSAAFEAAYSELGSIKKAGHDVSRDF